MKKWKKIASTLLCVGATSVGITASASSVAQGKDVKSSQAILQILETVESQMNSLTEPHALDHYASKKSSKMRDFSPSLEGEDVDGQIG